MAKKAKPPAQPVFPANLRKARQAKGLTQEGAARLLDVTLLTWGRWERGQSKPDLDTLDRIAELLEVRSGWLVDGYGDPTPPTGK